MARLWSGGFELNTTTNNVEWNGSSSGSPTIQSTTVRSGTYAMQITGLTSATAMRMAHVFGASDGTGPFYVRFYLRVGTRPSAENRIFTINAASSGMRVAIGLMSTGALRLRDEDGIIGSDSSVLSNDTWYRIEVQFNNTAAAGSHVVRATIDGVEFAGSATRSISSGVQSFIMGGNIAGEAQTTGNWYFDDVALNDGTGSFQNTYPGAGSIIHLRPNALGDNSGWVNTFTQIDEVTPDDASTIISDNVLNEIEDVNLDDTPSAINSYDNINVVQVGSRFNASSATDPDPAFCLRIKAGTGGTVEESAAITAGTSAWNTHITATPRNYQLTLYDLPGASTTAWTKGDLDNAQIGVRITTGDTDSVQVTVLWLLVDYSTGTPPSTVVKDIIGGGMIPFAR